MVLRRLDLAISLNRLVVLPRDGDNGAQCDRITTSTDEVVAAYKLLVRPATQLSIPDSNCVCDDIPFTVALRIFRLIRHFGWTVMVLDLRTLASVVLVIESRSRCRCSLMLQSQRSTRRI